MESTEDCVAWWLTLSSQVSVFQLSSRVLAIVPWEPRKSSINVLFSHSTDTLTFAHSYSHIFMKVFHGQPNQRNDSFLAMQARELS